MTDHAELIAELLAEVRSDGDVLAGPSDLDRRAADALSSLVRERDALRETNCKLHRRAQQAESDIRAGRDEIIKARPRDQWGGTDRAFLQIYHENRDLRSRATAAEADAARMREALEQARHELWHLGLVIGQIAKWPRHYFNRVYIEEWVIRTAKIFERWGERERADEILAVTSSHTKTNERLEAARNALGGKDE